MFVPFFVLYFTFYLFVRLSWIMWIHITYREQILITDLVNDRKEKYYSVFNESDLFKCVLRRLIKTLVSKIVPIWLSLWEKRKVQKDYCFVRNGWEVVLHDEDGISLNDQFLFQIKMTRSQILIQMFLSTQSFQWFNLSQKLEFNTVIYRVDWMYSTKIFSHISFEQLSSTFRHKSIPLEIQVNVIISLL